MIRFYSQITTQNNNNKNYAIMERVVFISCDLVNKEFQVEVSPTFIAKDMKTASHVLTLVTDQAARRGQRVNNVKMKSIKLWDKTDFNE